LLRDTLGEDVQLDAKSDLRALFGQVTLEVNAFAEMVSTVEANAKTLLTTAESRKKSAFVSDKQSEPFKYVLNSRYKSAHQKDVDRLRILLRDIRTIYGKAVMTKVSSDDIKGKISKLIPAEGQLSYDIFKEETALVKDENGNVVPILQCSNAGAIDGGKYLPDIIGTGCGWLECTTYLTALAKNENNPPDAALQKDLVDSSDFKACAALDASYRAYSKIYKVPPDSGEPQAGPLKKYEYVADKCGDEVLKASGACKKFDDKKAIQNACRSALVYHKQITDRRSGQVTLATKINAAINREDVLLQMVPGASLPDPPIDSISHQINFIVTYGVNASPNWTLATFKGPGSAGNLASAAGTRNHLLTIAIGPRNGSEKVSAEQGRAIQNLNILTLRPQ
jgi:hypothetical protein